MTLATRALIAAYLALHVYACVAYPESNEKALADAVVLLAKCVVLLTAAFRPARSTASAAGIVFSLAAAACANLLITGMHAAVIATIIDAGFVRLLFVAVHRSTQLRPGLRRCRSRRKSHPLVPAPVMEALEDIRQRMHADVASADLLIATMASFLRLLIDCTAQKMIPLYRDIELANRYIEVEECRRARDFHIDCVLDEAALWVAVPFLSTQRLVEFMLSQDRMNAAAPLIRINVTCDGALLSIRVDSGQPVPAGAEPARLMRAEQHASLRALFESCGGAEIQLLSDAAGPVCVTLALPAEPLP